MSKLNEWTIAAMIAVTGLWRRLRGDRGDVMVEWVIIMVVVGLLAIGLGYWLNDTIRETIQRFMDFISTWWGQLTDELGV